MADKPAAPATGPATGTGDAAAGDALDALDAALADGDAGATDAADWVAPTQAEWQAQQDAHKAALDAEKGKLTRARTQAERLRKDKGAAAPATAATATEGAAAADGATTAQLAALEQRAVAAERRAVVAAARVQLTQRGAAAGLLDLAVARLNVADVQFDGDEPILDVWLDEMEEKYPQLFAKADAAPSIGRQQVGTVNQGAAAVRTPKKLGFGDQVLAASKQARR